MRAFAFSMYCFIASSVETPLRVFLEGFKGFRDESELANGSTYHASHLAFPLKSSIPGLSENERKSS